MGLHFVTHIAKCLKSEQAAAGTTHLVPERFTRDSMKKRTPQTDNLDLTPLSKNWYKPTSKSNDDSIQSPFSGRHIPTVTFGSLWLLREIFRLVPQTNGSRFDLSFGVT